MKPSFVFATADSRLHADIMMIRLRRAGIPINKVSALFSRRFAPNSFFFWLRRPRTLRSGSAKESVFVAGPLERLFRRGGDVEEVAASLQSIGLAPLEADHLGRALWLGHAMLGVQAKTEDEVSIAWHIFKHARAENIAIAGPAASEPAGKTEPASWMPAVAA